MKKHIRQGVRADCRERKRGFMAVSCCRRGGTGCAAPAGERISGGCEMLICERKKTFAKTKVLSSGNWI